MRILSDKDQEIRRLDSSLTLETKQAIAKRIEKINFKLM